ncbi:MAG: hypothetical protein M5U07_16685 [Xanthobacteraceae bacterium]|nr:hypothetical protein [Xanthobacteraceae bacterium]
MKAHLVLLETAGNQQFVFATNKLRENVGASELIHSVGTSFVLSAVAEQAPAYRPLADRLAQAHVRADGGSGAEPLATSKYVAMLARIAEGNPLGPGVPVEVLVATSGKAVLLVADAETGRRIVTEVTRRALSAAPGVVVRGLVHADELDLDGGAAGAHAQMTALHAALDGLRLRLPASEARFPTLPIVAPCASSGQPAEHRVRPGDDAAREEHLSAASHGKRDHAQAGWLRVRATLGARGRDLAAHVGRLEDMGLAWLGVVHADGNGFGKVFLDLARHMPAELPACIPHGPGTASAYCAFYRRLSLALDLAGVAALRSSVAAFDKLPVRLRGGEREKFLPVVPLVFGGDDLTLICDGSRAVTFARAYLRAFEQATEAAEIDGFVSVIPLLRDPDLPASHPGETKKFGGAAGVAIVKPHHPYHRAYDLAEELTRSAKITKTLLADDAVSAIDFQVVYQDAGRGLRGLREDVDREPALLHARPYLTSSEDRLARARNGRNVPWARLHHIDGLARAARALAPPADAEDADPRSYLPRTQQHALRSALFEGPAIARSRLALVADRYDEVDWPAFDGSGSSLYFEEDVHPSAEAGQEGPERRRRTRFIDALELIDIGEPLAGSGANARGAAE